MSCIKSRNTGPEVLFRKLLWNSGFRGYRIHSDLPGRPDIVFANKQVAVFIDGCFWHKCPLCFQTPATRKTFWVNKINQNVIRDRNVNRKLKADGWKIFRIWEHQLRDSRVSENYIKKIKKYFDDCR